MATATITLPSAVLISGGTSTTPTTPSEVANGPRLICTTSIPATIRKKNITKLVMSVYCSGTRAAQQQIVFSESFYVYGYGGSSSGGRPYGYGDLRSYGSGWRWISFELTGTSGTTAAGGGYGKLSDGAMIYGSSYCEGYPSYSTGSVKVYPPGSGNAPYITATYENAVLYASGVSPAAGYVNNHEAITFSWTPKTDAKTIDPLSQASAVFRWKDGANGAVHTVNVGTDNFVTLAADTLPNSSEIMWSVQLTTDDGVQDPSPEWFTVTTIDVEPTVTGISPSGGYVSGSDNATFRWNYNISTGTPQSAWEIQVKAAADVAWTDYASGSTPDTEVTVSGSGLPSGNAAWRVRGANSDGEWSEWSSPLSYVTIAPPNPPVVTITERTARPTVTWTSADQQAFRVNIGDYDSGIVYGTEKTFKCPVYQPAGQIIIRVKVVNDLNLWSDWGETLFQLAAPSGPVPVLTAAGGISAGLSWDSSPDLADVVHADGTNNSVTYDWTGDTCVITRTAANATTSLRTVIGTTVGFIDGLVKGATYRFSWSGTPTESVHFGFQFYKGGGSTKSHTVWLEHDQTEGLLTVPDDGVVTGARACLFMDGGTAVGTTATVSGMQIRRAWDAYAVFRDGERIGETAEQTFTDQLAAPGWHTWFVRGMETGSDVYGDSAAVQAEIAVPADVIAELGGEWMEIGLSAVQSPNHGETRGASVAMLRLAGAVYPVPEIGPQRTRTWQLAFGSMEPATADRFETLVGKIVVVKSRYGRQIVGIMTEITRGQNWAMVTYSATVQEVDESAYR